MRVCEERDLPIALKIGAHRGVNPGLKSAGDGVVAFADTGVLVRLCTCFPKVRFLATLLSFNNQHEACVLASKFRNLHIYGCWWLVRDCGCVACVPFDEGLTFVYSGAYTGIATIRRLLKILHKCDWKCWAPPLPRNTATPEY
jgi:hypothetical protein